MNDFKIVSFYTGNGVYAEMAGRLRESCDKFKIECDIEEYNYDEYIKYMKLIYG